MEFANHATDFYLGMKEIDSGEIEDRRLSLISATKENVEIRRRVMMAVDPGTFVATYLHN